MCLKQGLNLFGLTLNFGAAAYLGFKTAIVRRREKELFKKGALATELLPSGSELLWGAGFFCLGYVFQVVALFFS